MKKNYLYEVSIYEYVYPNEKTPMPQKPDVKDSFYQKLFLFAAIWNFGAGFLAIVSLKFNIETFYGVADYEASDLFKLHYYNFWMLDDDRLSDRLLEDRRPDVFGY